ncbi:uncharacterized protein BX664DRAFT_335143 [Halteromyces radiatus]|uniref:uncharacterized protein n=1 Tax=Halteromyces radiatus TaxID=101107 RepID=UPI00221F209A|nr:uncharacterized protein BX664DRAFT_335143 [Halteromyces radiatus]KAI8086194.1 hypothetical protein BX664DRAFT_335143 [Halteromyces radiatus]
MTFVQLLRSQTPRLKHSTSLRTVISKRWASTNTTGEAVKEETFNNNVWRNTILLAIAGFIWYRIDERVTDQGDEKHPVTNWIEYHMNKSQDNDQIAETNFDNAKKIAEYKLVYQDAQRPPIYRMRYPETFERSSPRALVTGNNCDLSDVKIRQNTE